MLSFSLLFCFTKPPVVSFAVCDYNPVTDLNRFEAGTLENPPAFGLSHSSDQNCERNRSLGSSVLGRCCQSRKL